MTNVKCSGCGFVGWGGFEGCKNCGAKFLPPPASSVSQSPSFVEYETIGQSPTPVLQTGLAVASFVIGLLNLFTLGFLGLGVILGITLAAVALSKAKNHPSVYGGKDFAIAGLVVNIVSILVIVPIGIVTAIVITNVNESRRTANEVSAIQTLRKISAAESVYVDLLRVDFGDRLWHACATGGHWIDQ